MRTKEKRLDTFTGTIRKLLYKLNLSLQGNSLGFLKQLEYCQWLDQERTITLQRRHLKNLLVHAYQHVPYYREILANTELIENNGRVNLDCFTKIPLLNKNTVHKHFNDLKSNDLSTRIWYQNSSGGSTGEPVRFIQDNRYFDWTQAVKMLYDLWTGYSLPAVKVLLWGSERDLFVGRETIKTRVDRWLRNQIWLNSFRMTPDRMRSYVEQIGALKPVQILAYAESIYELSRFIERERLRVYSPRAIMTSAGTLHSHIRETIERVFKSPVFNRYGSREVGDIASECDRHQGLHVSALTHYVEILMPDGQQARPDQLGEIVVTCLTNYAMPLIRYRIGDMGMWGDTSCPCGRSWLLIKNVTGRVTDVFIKKDGGIVSPEYLIHLIGVVLNSGWIRKYQVVQEDYDLIRVIIAPHRMVNDPHEFYAGEMNRITAKIQLVMGQYSRVEYEYVDDIAPTESGKYRYTVSKVPVKSRPDYQSLI